MSDHAATVRRFLYPGYISPPSGWKEAHDALDALMAERLRPTPVQSWELPRPALGAPVEEGEFVDEYDEARSF